MIDLDVEVSGGVGEADFPPVFHGVIVLVCIKVPGVDPVPTYDFNIMDQDGFGLFGSGGNQGTVTISVRFPVVSGLVGGTLNVLNATADGTYTFRFYPEGD